MENKEGFFRFLIFLNMENTNISLFEGTKIRKIYDEKKEKWYFSVIDVV